MLAFGGEGAPLAPLADAYLFAGYDFYLNLGGIANLSAQHNGQWLAFDVAPANQVLNYLAGEMGLPNSWPAVTGAQRSKNLPI